MKRPDGPSARHGVFAWMAVAVALALAVGAAYGFWSTTAQSDLLYLASLLAVAALLYRGYEIPLRRWMRDKFARG